jgi:hypothetical protein
LDGLANPRAADGFAVKGDSRECTNREPQFVAKLTKELDVASTFVAKKKISADTQALDLPKAVCELADENGSGLFAEKLIEMEQQQRVRSERFYGAQLLRQRVDEQWYALGSDGGVGVAIERDNESNRFVLVGIGDRLANYLLMANMNAVKESNSDTNLPTSCFETANVADDVHGR